MNLVEGVLNSNMVLVASLLLSMSLIALIALLIKKAIKKMNVKKLHLICISYMIDKHISSVYNFFCRQTKRFWPQDYIRSNRDEKFKT